MRRIEFCRPEFLERFPHIRTKAYLLADDLNERYGRQDPSRPHTPSSRSRVRPPDYLSFGTVDMRTIESPPPAKSYAFGLALWKVLEARLESRSRMVEAGFDDQCVISLFENHGPGSVTFSGINLIHMTRPTAYSSETKKQYIFRTHLYSKPESFSTVRNIFVAESLEDIAQFTGAVEPRLLHHVRYCSRAALSLAIP